MSIISELQECRKGVSIYDDLSIIGNPLTKQYSLKDPIRQGKVFESNILSAPTPKNIEYRNRNSQYFVDQYRRASFYFFNCSILSTVVIRICLEALRNGIEWVPKFQSKCPRCGETFQRSMRLCSSCGFEGDMLKPDTTQQKLLINWEGGSLFDKVNENGWTLLQLCRSFLTISLTYNQPVILCKSVYLVDEHVNVLEEIPQQFIPLSPSKARMIFDDSGTPGDGYGFSLDDRTTNVDLYSDEIKNTGYFNGKRIYPARWSIFENDGGQETSGEYYASPEIYCSHYGVDSMTYGLPLSLLVESDVRAWIAMELRVEKYYSVGHPQGIFVINNAGPDALATVTQTIKIQMKDDPYTIPIIGIPPSSDKVTSTKWHPLADNPTEQMMAVKSELQQRISAIFGVSGLFTGDTNSLKGNSNESSLMDIMDRNLVGIRTHVNDFLKFIKSKYKGIVDWELRVVEPPDNQSIDEAEEFNKNLMNAKMAKDLGFDIISQKDGKIEISYTPRKLDPIKSLFQPAGGAEGQGVEDMEAESEGDNGYNMSKSKQSDSHGDNLMEMTKGEVEVSIEDAKKILLKHGVVVR